MLRGNRTYPPLRPSSRTERSASRWWRPLTQWWGLLGVIIFIGLVMRMIDSSTAWRVRQSEPLSGKVASAPAPRSDQSLAHPQAAHTVRSSP